MAARWSAPPYERPGRRHGPRLLGSAWVDGRRDGSIPRRPLLAGTRERRPRHLEQAVASYVAKYATKAAETTGTVDRRIGNKEALDLLDVPEHPARLIAACLDLHPLYPERKLRDWAHMLGFRGHFSTKSRSYSTTFGALRQTRADYRAAQQRTAPGLPDPGTEEEATTLTLAHWAYAGHGHTPGESWLAANIRREITQNRETAREELPALLDLEGVTA